MWSLVIAGAVIAAVSLYQLPYGDLNPRFGFLCLMVMASSLIAIPIPRVSGRITVADTFVFLTMLLYGGPAAVLVSALEGVAATLIISKRPRTILFNSAILATSTFCTATVLHLKFGSIVAISQNFTQDFFIAVQKVEVARIAELKRIVRGRLLMISVAAMPSSAETSTAAGPP